MAAVPLVSGDVADTVEDGTDEGGGEAGVQASSAKPATSSGIGR
jgi:hypothetical protein